MAPYTDYFLKKDGLISPFITLRQLSKLFDEKADLFKAYTKSHKVNYDKQESLVELIKYMEL
jgi:hypothetical protein